MNNTEDSCPHRPAHIAPTKAAREAIISEILCNREVGSQIELRRLLAQRGIETTQATLSRDLLELRATKIRNSRGKQVYSLPAPYPVMVIKGQEDPSHPKLSKWCQDLLVSSDVAYNQVVLRTPNGGAELLAGGIDSAWFDSVLGCIAGNDTVLVICRTAEDAQELHQKFIDMIYRNN